MNDHKALELARKLRRLQKQAGTPEEAHAAARVLAKLIERHRIDEAALDGDERESFELPVESLLEGYRVSPWKEDMAAMLCRFYGVFLYRSTAFVRRKKKRMRASGYFMCGTPDDVATVRYMFAWLSGEAMRLARGVARRGRGVDSWRLGFVHGISAQLAAARKEAAKERAEPDTSRALVRLDTRLDRASAHAALAMGKRLPTKKTGDGNPGANRDCYLKGLMRGSNFHLGKTLPEGGPQP